MPVNDTLHRIGKNICEEEYLNFAPTSNATKPPHIANGLFRLCSGETCQSKDVHDWTVSENKKDAVSSEEILEKYSDILERNNNEKLKNIKEFRFLLSEIFNQDNTMYPSYEFSVMTLSSHWMIKPRLSPEAHIGDFLFEVLSKNINGKSSKAIDMIKKALADDTDDLTKLVKPILTMPVDGERRNVVDVEYPDDRNIKWDSYKEKIRNGFDKLADNLHETQEEKNSLLVLKRFVNFSVFSALLYLINAKCVWDRDAQVPILLDAGSDLDSIKKASEQTFTLAKKSVEDYFVYAIHKIIDSEIASNSKNACLNWIDRMSFSNDKREESIKPAIKSYFTSFVEEGDKPKQALSRAIQIALWTFEYKKNSPSDFCRVLGVRTGLVGPKGNRATIKRYLVNSFMLETITLSVLSKDELREGIEMKELGEKLIEQYTILIGANSEKELEILEKNNIAQSTPGDLRGDLSLNAKRLADTYILLGFGKRYADGVTIIGWRL